MYLMQNTKKNTIKNAKFLYFPFKKLNLFFFFPEGGEYILTKKIYLNDISVIFINENACKHHRTTLPPGPPDLEIFRDPLGSSNLAITDFKRKLR